jgi:hypothetical protein
MVSLLAGTDDIPASGNLVRMAGKAEDSVLFFLVQLGSAGKPGEERLEPNMRSLP